MIESEVTPEWQAQVSEWLVRSGCRFMMAWGLNCGDWDWKRGQANLLKDVNAQEDLERIRLASMRPV